MQRITQRKQGAIAIALALAAMGATGAAHAVSFEKDGITVDINGTINGFLVMREDTAADRTKTRNSGISNGLLPGWLNFVATTNVSGNEIKAHFGFAPGINDNSTIVGLPGGANGGANTGFPYTQIDTRNIYFSVTNPGWGSVKVGRDIGLFGQNVILSDMTLIGVGGTTGAAQPFNTTFGMIGTGYMYVGFQPQITYTTPKMGIAQASAGIFQPKQFANAAGTPSTHAENPAFQAKVDFELAKNVKAWGGLISQQNQGGAGTPDSPKGVSSNGFEIGAKAGLGDAEFVAYGFQGKGLGLSTVGAQFLGAASAAGEKTDSSGHFVQATYKITPSTKIGVNYGQNKDEGGAVGAGSEIKRTGYTAGVYHSLNKHVSLVAEMNEQERKLDGAFDGKTRTLSAGAILFF